MTNMVTRETELSSRCLNILVREVGPVDAERFIAYVNRERLDYTKWQQTLFAGQSIEEIAAASRRVSAQVIARRAQRLHAMT